MRLLYGCVFGQKEREGPKVLADSVLNEAQHMFRTDRHFLPFIVSFGLPPPDRYRFWTIHQYGVAVLVMMGKSRVGQDRLGLTLVGSGTLAEKQKSVLLKWGGRILSGIPTTIKLKKIPPKMWTAIAETLRIELFLSEVNAETKTEVVAVEVEKTKEAMRNTMEKLVQRGDTLDGMVERASALQQSTESFKKMATKTKREAWKNNCKEWICPIFCATLLLFLMAVCVFYLYHEDIKQTHLTPHPHNSNITR